MNFNRNKDKYSYLRMQFLRLAPRPNLNKLLGAYLSQANRVKRLISYNFGSRGRT